MLRALIVLPMYLAVIYFLPRTPWYDRFHAAVVESDPHMIWHIAGYGAALAISVIWALLIEFGKQPRTYAQTVLTQILKLGLVGVIFASSYQLFQFFTGGELSVFALMIPPMFMAAELTYLFLDYVVSLFQRKPATLVQRQ